MNKRLLNMEDNVVDAERSINEEVHKYKLDFAELSPVIRELLGSVYIRGGLDALKKIKNDQPTLFDLKKHD